MNDVSVQYLPTTNPVSLAPTLDPHFVMVKPNRVLAIDAILRKKIAAHLKNVYQLTYAAAIKFVPMETSQWGKLKQLGGGDMIHARDAVDQGGRSLFRDMTFVKVRSPPYHTHPPSTH